MFLVLITFFVTAFQTGSEEVSRVGTNLPAKKIERVTEPEIDVLLNDVERNSAKLPHVTVFHQQLGRASHNATQPGVAHEHVVRFFGKHELTRARERLEA